uniref:Uncharacterized protein n=1 Tax=Arion vulgaris TaxID=1028688 RepID=A0A0B7A4H9_9EUPU
MSELNCSTDKKRHRKKRDKHNHSDADFKSANTTEATSLDLVPECSKKRKHKKTKQKFDDSDEHLHAFNCNKETGVEMEMKKQFIATGDAHKKFKPQDNKQASETSCDANVTEKTIKRKNKKKEKTVSTDTLVSCDNTEPPNKKKKSDTFNDDVSVSLIYSSVSDGSSLLMTT